MGKDKEAETEDSDFKTLAEVGKVDGKYPIVVTIQQYKDNAPKVVAKRLVTKKKTGEGFGKLGGMTASEAAAVGALFIEASKSKLLK